MTKGWQYKVAGNPKTTNTDINTWLSLAAQNGALGGKLMGAGGGGYLLFYTEERERLCEFMRQHPDLKEQRFSFESRGCRVESISPTI